MWACSTAEVNYIRLVVSYGPSGAPREAPFRWPVLYGLKFGPKTQKPPVSQGFL